MLKELQTNRIHLPLVQLESIESQAIITSFVYGQSYLNMKNSCYCLNVFDSFRFRNISYVNFILRLCMWDITLLAANIDGLQFRSFIEVEQDVMALSTRFVSNHSIIGNVNEACEKLLENVIFEHQARKGGKFNELLEEHSQKIDIRGSSSCVPFR